MFKKFLLIWCHCAFFVNCAFIHDKYSTDFIEKSLNETVLAYNLTDLSSADHHFGSTLQLINIKVAANNKFNEDIVRTIVLKTSLQNTDRRDCLRNLKECRFYDKIVPALKSFEESSRILEADRANMLPQYFGCRLSLNPNAEMPDMGFALLLENLKMQNYNNVGKFTNDEISVILKEMAKFHASFIAMRRLQPQLFNAHVKPFLVNALYLQNIDEVFETITKELNLVQNLSTKTRISVSKYLRPSIQFRNDSFRSIESPFSTICHTDFKSGNIMIKRGASKSEAKVKFIDFQQYIYNSFVYDLLLFALNNVSIDDLTVNFSDLVKVYHAEFYKTIKSYNCPSEDYTLEKVWEEIRGKSKFQLFGLIYWSRKNVQNLMKSGNIIDHRHASEAILHNWKSIIDFFNEFELLD